MQSLSHLDPLSQSFWNACCTGSPFNPLSWVRSAGCDSKSLYHRCNSLVYGFLPCHRFSNSSSSPLDKESSWCQGLSPNIADIAPAQTPRNTLTRAGVRAEALLTAVSDRFKDSPEEFFGDQGPSHLGSCLLKEIRKLCGWGEKRKEEEQILIKAH